jgi:hypothetical protein
MAFHMKTSLNIDDTVMTELKREAARQGRSISKLVETALRLLFRSQQKRQTIPSFQSSTAAAASSILPTATFYHAMIVLAIDANVLVYVPTQSALSSIVPRLARTPTVT